MSPRTTGLAALVLAALLSMFVVAAATQAAPDKKAGKPAKTVKSASDGAKSKLHPKLQKQVESGSTDSIHVFVTVAGNPAPAASLLDDAKTAPRGSSARRRHDRRADAAQARLRQGRRGRQPDRVQADGPAARRSRPRGRQDPRREDEEQDPARVPGQGSAVRQGARAEGIELRGAQGASPSSTRRRTTSRRPGTPATPVKASPSASSTAARTSATPTCSARGRPGRA